MPVVTDAKIVVVDDEQHITELIKESLTEDKFSVSAFTDPTKAIEYMAGNHVDLVLTDLLMEGCTGNQVLEAAHKYNPDSVVIVMTAHPTVEVAISALKQGAYDFLVKPFKLELLKAAIKRGLSLQKALRDNLKLRGQVDFLSAANSCAAEQDLDGYLAKVLASCRTELVADAAAVIQIDHRTGKILRKLHDADNNSDLDSVLDDFLLEGFAYTRSRKPIIRSEKLKENGITRHRLLVSKPIFIRQTLHGTINLLIYSQSGKISPGELDVLTILTNSAAAAIGNDNLYRDLQSSYMQAIRGLAKSIEARDEHTAGHTDRVTILATVLATSLGWSEEKLQQLKVGCTLHDIGKIGVPDAVLNKPGRLTEEEQEQMQSHANVGLKIVSGIDLFKPAIPYIISHHERFDGNGYPGGLKGEEIPIEGRLLAVVDTFDAILSDRPYRKGASFEVAINELVNNRGSQFDAEIVDKFIEVIRSGKIDFKLMYNRNIDISLLKEVEVTSEKTPV